MVPQRFSIDLVITDDGTAQLSTIVDGDKETIIPVMSMAFLDAIKKKERVEIKAFEILHSVGLTVLDRLPGLESTTKKKYFNGGLKNLD